MKSSEEMSQWQPWLACSAAKRRFIAVMAILVTGATTLLTLPLPVFSNRLLLKSKADQAQGTPSVYRPRASSHKYNQFSRYLTMTDGTKIAVEVYLPKPLKDGETIPTIYEQSRYWRVIQPKAPLNLLYSKPISPFRAEFLSHGYAWVVSDARGAGASFGDRPWEFLPVDITDSKQVMDWIVKQTWSNGKIGLAGHSYSGNMAEFALINKHPAVKAAAVLSSPFDLYADVLRPGGLPLKPFVDNWMSLNQRFDQNKLPKNLSKLRFVVRNMKPVDEDKDRHLLSQALAEHKNNSVLETKNINFRDDPATANDRAHSRTFDESMSMLKDRYGDKFTNMGVEASSPSDYWKDIDGAGVPLYVGAGWLDGANSNAAVKRFINYTTPGTKLILGPWDHDFFNISPFTRGGFSRFRIAAELLKFFDHYLKGIDCLSNDSPVNYFTLGEEKWHGSESWPPKNEPFIYYLTEAGLSATRPANKSSRLYTIAESSGTGHHGRWDCLLGNILLDPYPDRKQQDKRLLVFDSKPLTENLDVTGNPSAKIWLKPSAKDCSLFLYLEDVWTDGSVHYVSEGEVFCGNRLNANAAAKYKTVTPMRTFLAQDYKALTPGEPTEVAIEFFPISYQFKAGHRIRLSIAGKDKDHFAVPAFTEASDNFDVDFGPEQPSLLSLPVEPQR
jgi:putative CocE/NonD family hydrolase